MLSPSFPDARQQDYKHKLNNGMTKKENKDSL